MKGKLSSLRPEVLLKAVDTSYCFAIRLIYACYTLCGELNLQLITETRQKGPKTQKYIFSLRFLLLF